MLERVACAYCGDTSTEWDHLRPLVDKQRPTGYISEIRNLVPACGKCNQSKGNKAWRTWMFSDARLSPKRRGVADIDARAARIVASIASDLLRARSPHRREPREAWSTRRSAYGTPLRPSPSTRRRASTPQPH
ncbi:HNH endonuclease [Microbacterium galbinum]|uniref:HNH endonuclease n=1 Tax=Microbacterium galbinum TaxID=2851646 RepID=UPI003556F0CC